MDQFSTQDVSKAFTHHGYQRRLYQRDLDALRAQTEAEIARMQAHIDTHTEKLEELARLNPTHPLAAHYVPASLGLMTVPAGNAPPSTWTPIKRVPSIPTPAAKITAAVHKALGVPS